MSSFTIRWLLPTLVCFPVLLSAAPLTLEQAERLALENNPALHARSSDVQAMAAIPPQAGSLPDPTISLNAMNLPADTFSTSQENPTQLQIGLTQTLPFPGKLSLRQAVADRYAEAAISNRDEFRLMLLRNIRMYWWNLAYLDKAIQIVRNNQTLLRNLVQVSESKYKTGKGLQQDVLLAQLELSRLLEKELSLVGEREIQRSGLNTLMGRDSAMPLELPDTLPEIMARMPDIAGLKIYAKGHRPLLSGLNQRVDAADAMVSLAEKDYYPDFKLGAAYGFRQGSKPSGEARADLASVMLSMNLPIFSGNKQSKAVDQRKAEMAKAKFSWQDGLNRVNSEIDMAASELRISREQLSLFKQGIIPQARQTTASMLAGYQVNKVDFLNLVRAQLNEFNNEIQYWQLYARTQQAAARLAAAAGKEHLDGEIYE